MNRKTLTFILTLIFVFGIFASSFNLQADASYVSEFVSQNGAVYNNGYVKDCSSAGKLMFYRTVSGYEDITNRYNFGYNEKISIKFYAEKGSFIESLKLSLCTDDDKTDFILNNSFNDGENIAVFQVANLDCNNADLRNINKIELVFNTSVDQIICISDFSFDEINYDINNSSISDCDTLYGISVTPSNVLPIINFDSKSQGYASVSFSEITDKFTVSKYFYESENFSSFILGEDNISFDCGNFNSGSEFCVSFEDSKGRLVFTKEISLQNSNEISVSDILDTNYIDYFEIKSLSIQFSNINNSEFYLDNLRFLKSGIICDLGYEYEKQGIISDNIMIISTCDSALNWLNENNNLGSVKYTTAIKTEGNGSILRRGNGIVVFRRNLDLLDFSAYKTLSFDVLTKSENITSSYIKLYSGDGVITLPFDITKNEFENISIDLESTLDESFDYSKISKIDFCFETNNETDIFIDNIKLIGDDALNSLFSPPTGDNINLYFLINFISIIMMVIIIRRKYEQRNAK